MSRAHHKDNHTTVVTPSPKQVSPRGGIPYAEYFKQKETEVSSQHECAVLQSRQQWVDRMRPRVVLSSAPCPCALSHVAETQQLRTGAQLPLTMCGYAIVQPNVAIDFDNDDGDPFEEPPAQVS